jgi:D-hydroxyproline dehydrogenase subunit beta
VTDVIVIGGGIIGTSAAVFLAERGARVTLLEADVVAAAASGRNAGSIEHPWDEIRAPLYDESVRHYRRFGVIDGEPVGLLAVSTRSAGASRVAETASRFPGLDPKLLDDASLRATEPELAPDLFGCLVQTGFPAHPAMATHRFADVARELGVVVRESAPATPVIDRGRAVGAATADGVLRADAVLVAAGPWTPTVIDATGSWRHVIRSWGVTVQIALERPLRHRIVEFQENGYGAAASFEVTPLGNVHVLGATRTEAEPDPTAVAPLVRQRAARFLPVVAQAPTIAVRACARPVSTDGVPLLGPLPGVEGLYVAVGHGGAGISLGPASGRIVADAMLRNVPVPECYSASRFGRPTGSHLRCDRPEFPT